MKAKKLLLTISVLASLVAGCHARKSVVSVESYNRQISLDTERRLAEAATSISHSLTELAAIEKSNQRSSKLRSPVDAELVGMNQLTSIDWSGPVEPLIKKLATLCNYKVNILGTRPGIPVLISITAKSRTVADILRDVNFQCASKANIEIYPANRVIELRYNR